MKTGQSHSQNRYNGTLCRTFLWPQYSSITANPTTSRQWKSLQPLQDEFENTLHFFVSLPQSQSPREEHSRLCCHCLVAKFYLPQQPPLSIQISQARILEWVAISFSRDSRLCFGQILNPYLASGEWDKNIFIFLRNLFLRS